MSVLQRNPSKTSFVYSNVFPEKFNIWDTTPLICCQSQSTVSKGLIRSISLLSEDCWDCWLNNRCKKERSCPSLNQTDAFVHKMTSHQLYMRLLRFLLSYMRIQAAGQNGPSGSTLNQQLAKLASPVLAQGKRDRCSSGVEGGRSSRYFVYLPIDAQSWANSFISRIVFAHVCSWGDPEKTDPRSHLPALSGLKHQFLALSKDLCSGKKQMLREGEISALFRSVHLPSEDPLSPATKVHVTCQSHQQSEWCHWPTSWSVKDGFWTKLTMSKRCRRWISGS